MPDRQRVLGRIRLRHLQCFQAVARLGSLRRAAEALSVTQPAVTKTLNELEEMLGTPLLLRGRRGATLTPEAEAFLVHANASLSALTQAVDSVAAAPHEAVLRIGVLPTVAPFAAQALQALRATRPLTTVRVSSGRNQELIDQLRGHELEAVLARLAEVEAGTLARLPLSITPEEPVGLIIRTDSLHSPALDTWLAAVRQAAAERRRFNRTLAPAGGPRRGARA
jgi:LysR family pca operon transcriptional activator